MDIVNKFFFNIDRLKVHMSFKQVNVYNKATHASSECHLPTLFMIIGMKIRKMMTKRSMNETNPSSRN